MQARIRSLQSRIQFSMPGANLSRHTDANAVYLEEVAKLTRGHPLSSSHAEDGPPREILRPLEAAPAAGQANDAGHPSLASSGDTNAQNLAMQVESAVAQLEQVLAPLELPREAHVAMIKDMVGDADTRPSAEGIAHIVQARRHLEARISSTD